MLSLPTSKRLRISGPASDDLAAIGDYTRREWGAAQKKKYLTSVRHCLRSLAHNPLLGISRDEIDTGLRSHPVERHVVFYRESARSVDIVRVLHQSMDVERHIE